VELYNIFMEYSILEDVIIYFYYLKKEKSFFATFTISDLSETLNNAYLPAITQNVA